MKERSRAEGVSLDFIFICERLLQVTISFDIETNTKNIKLTKPKIKFRERILSNSVKLKSG